MKGIGRLLSPLLLTTLPWPAVAGNLVGVGSYATGVLVNTNNSSDETFKFRGHIVYGTLDLNRYLALRGAYYLQREYHDQQLKIRGYNAQLLLGNNFGRRGFNAYGGAGYYLETIRQAPSAGRMDAPDDEAFEGLQVTLGLAYNWSRVTFDWWVTARDTRQYVSYLERNQLYDNLKAEVTSASTGLALSLRF